MVENEFHLPKENSSLGLAAVRRHENSRGFQRHISGNKDHSDGFEFVVGRVEVSAKTRTTVSRTECHQSVINYMVSLGYWVIFQTKISLKESSPVKIKITKAALERTLKSMIMRPPVS